LDKATSENKAHIVQRHISPHNFYRPNAQAKLRALRSSPREPSASACG